MGFRFIFQSKNSTITDEEVKLVMSDIINLSLKIDSIEIPGLIKQ
jgi:phenylalanyl-tRNA synthetase beta subunit